MAFLDVLFGSSEQKADTIEQLPGIFDQGGEGSEIARFLRGIGEGKAGGGVRDFNIPESTPGFDISNFINEGSEFGGLFRDELTSPQFGARNVAEENLLGQVTDRFQGSQAIRNLGVTGGGFASAIAPLLVQLRQKRLENLFGGFKTELGGALEGRRQDITERGGDITSQLLARAQDIGLGEQGINTLLALLNLSRKTPVVRGGEFESFGGIIPGIGSLIPGGGGGGGGGSVSGGGSIGAPGP